MISASVPPQNVEAEQAVLGSMLLDRSAIASVVELLHADDFYKEGHRRIFSAILEMFEQGEQIDLISITDRLRDKRELDDVGGVAYVIGLPNGVPTAANVETYARIVKTKSAQRRALLVFQAAAQKVAGGDGGMVADVRRVLDELESGPQGFRAGPVLTPLADVRPRLVSWLRPQRWPQGKLSLVVGDPGLGKSCLILDAAARISNGAEWPEGGRAPRGTVVILTAEDGLDDTVVPRLTAMGADLRNLMALTAIRQEGRERIFSLAVDLPHLEAVVRERRPLALFIDPLSAYLGRGVDSFVDADIRGLLSPLAKLAADFDVAICAVMHLNKGQTKALYRVTGSVAFVAAARSVFAVIPDPEADDSLAPTTRRFFAPVKMNLAPKPATLAFTIASTTAAARVAWEGIVSDVDVEAALRGNLDGDRSERLGADAWLRSVLEEAGGELRTADVRRIATEAGLAWHTVQRAKDRLGIRAVRQGRLGPAGFWVWTLAKSAAKNATLPEVAALNGDRAGHADQTRISPKIATSPEAAILGGAEDGQRQAEEPHLNDDDYIAKLDLRVLATPLVTPEDLAQAGGRGQFILRVGAGRMWQPYLYAPGRSIAAGKVAWLTFVRNNSSEELKRVVDAMLDDPRRVHMTVDGDRRALRLVKGEVV